MTNIHTNIGYPIPTGHVNYFEVRHVNYFDEIMGWLPMVPDLSCSVSNFIPFGTVTITPATENSVKYRNISFTEAFLFLYFGPNKIACHNSTHLISHNLGGYFSFVLHISIWLFGFISYMEIMICMILLYASVCTCYLGADIFYQHKKFCLMLQRKWHCPCGWGTNKELETVHTAG